MPSFHLFSMSTPFGRVTYAHQALDRLNDGAEDFITDATIDPEDGTGARPLSIDEVTQYLREWGPAQPLWPRRRDEVPPLG